MSSLILPLTTRHLVYRYPTGRGLAGVTLKLFPGETLGLLGPNGSGKSTLLRLLAGLKHPGGGTITLFGHPTPPIPSNLRRRLGVLFDAPAHFDDLTGRENAAFFAAAYGLSPARMRQQLLTLAGRFGLTQQLDDYVAAYSYGMRRKLALVETLLPEPDLLLLDEPGAGLDYAARLALHQTLKTHTRRGGAVILATNDITEAQTLCQRVLFLHHGQPVACDTPAALLSNLGTGRRITLRLTTPISLEPLASLPSITQVDATPKDEIVLISQNGRQSVEAVVSTVQHSGGEITALAVDAPNLGDVFLALTGQSLEANDA